MLVLNTFLVICYLAVSSSLSLISALLHLFFMQKISCHDVRLLTIYWDGGNICVWLLSGWSISGNRFFFGIYSPKKYHFIWLSVLFVLNKCLLLRSYVKHHMLLLVLLPWEENTNDLVFCFDCRLKNYVRRLRRF